MCLFNHSCRDGIKSDCAVKPLKLLSQRRDQEGPAAGSGVKQKLELPAHAIPLSAVSPSAASGDTKGGGAGELDRTLSHVDSSSATRTKKHFVK